MTITETILTQFKAREAEIKAQAAERDKAAAIQLQASEKRVKDIRAKLTAARENYDVMVADYMAVENAETMKSAAKLQESEMTLTKVKDKQASLKDFLETGLNDDALQKKAAGEAAGKLTAGLAVIRDQSRAILQLEKDEWDELLNIYYFQVEPARNQTLKLRAEIETLDRGISLVMEGGPHARSQKEEKQNALARANGKFITGKTWKDLDLEGLRALRFNCEIADVFLPDLEKIISEIKPGERVNVHLLSGLQTQGKAQLEYSLVVPDGCPITTTTAGLKK